MSDLNKVLLIIGTVLLIIVLVVAVAKADWNNWRQELERTEGFVSPKGSWSVEPETPQTRAGDEAARARIYAPKPPEVPRLTLPELKKVPSKVPSRKLAPAPEVSMPRFGDLEKSENEMKKELKRPKQWPQVKSKNGLTNSIEF